MKAPLLSLLLSAFCGVICAAEPLLEKLDLFTVGEDPAYQLYHIPGVVVTAKGSILAWCEARKHPSGVSDWDHIRILLRRSTDDGRTWDAPRNIAAVDGPLQKNPLALGMRGVDPQDITYNNPVLIAGRDGTVHMLFCIEYMRCFYQRSTDDGLTFSRPVEITATFEAFRTAYDWKVLATGPNHSIELSSGRLVVPVWLSTGTGGNAHRPSVTATIYSDDHGATWKAGDIAITCTEEWINPNETVALELRDGSVLLNARSESKAHRRLITTSRDGASKWSTPRFDDALLEPICMAGIVRYQHEGKQLILFSNPHNLSRAKGNETPGTSRDRRNLSIKLSSDEARSWSVNKPLEPGPSMYSDIAVSHAGTILCFYGRSGENTGAAAFAGGRLTMARFNLDWLTAP